MNFRSPGVGQIQVLPSNKYPEITMFASAVSLLALWASAHASPTQSAPTVAVRNGTYIGVHSTTYNQDFFLGMPYAQQPVGNLRFTVPQPLKESWSEARDAKEYSDICVGYGVSIPIPSIKGYSNRSRRTLSGIPSPKLV